LKNYLGAKDVVVVNSCTAALHLSLKALGVKEGDEVITTPFTFASTANTIVHCGAKPVFVDIKKDTLNIDTEKIKKAITSKTKAIIPVDYGGQACDIKAIEEIAKDKKLKVIEDAAHAIGSEYEGEKIGNFFDTTCFSFYAIKNMTTGDGGAIATNDNKIAEKLKTLRLHGISKDAWKRYSEKGSWYYEINEAGYKYNMGDIQAAMGIEQLKKLDKFIKIRRRYAQIYNEAFKDLVVDVPVEKENVKHSYHLYPILLKNYDRNKFIEEMRALNIG
ncbi:unnamed protein product, partial [marine sediment metagenome]